MDFRDFDTLYLSELQDARSLEEQQLGALAAMAEAAADRELADALQAHLAETRAHLDQVEEILDRHHAPRIERPAGAGVALIAAAREIAATGERGPLRDAALIAAAQRLDHYEIALYGTLATYAKLLGRHEEKRTLGALLEEERAADEDLSDIATLLVNPHAIEVGAAA